MNAFRILVNSKIMVRTQPFLGNLVTFFEVLFEESDLKQSSGQTASQNFFIKQKNERLLNRGFIYAGFEQSFTLTLV